MKRVAHLLVVTLFAGSAFAAGPAPRRTVAAADSSVPTLAVGSTSQNQPYVEGRNVQSPAAPPYSPPQAGGDGTSYWNAERHKYFMGFELGGPFGFGGTTSLLPKNAVVFGMWYTPSIAFEIYGGYNKPNDTYTETVVAGNNSIAGTSAINSTFTGVAFPHTFLIGGGIKYKIIQNSWFQFTGGAIVAVIPGNSASYRTGASSQNTPNVTSPGNFTTTETALGTISASTSSQILVGPKLGAEFYLKWIPHLALGFATGILTSFGGETTTTTNTRTRTYDTVNGVAQNPTVDTTASTSSVAKAGTGGLTFGLGGTTFSLTGLFTVRYVW